MKNFVSLGSNMTIPAPTGGVASGDGVVVENLFGVAFTSASAGEDVVIATQGVFVLPKLGTDTIAFGQRVFWDATAKRVTETATGNYPVGCAIEVAGNGATLVKVRLDGVSTAAVAAE